MDVQLSLGDKEGAASVGLGFGLQYLLNALPNVIVAGIPYRGACCHQQERG